MGVCSFFAGGVPYSCDGVNFNPISSTTNASITYNISGSASVNALFAVGKNKFDKTAATANTRLNVSTGAVTTNGAWSEYTSDYIPVLPDTQYATSDVYPNVIVQYDSNKAFISGTSPFDNTHPLTMAANAAYVRVQTWYPNTFQIEVGATASFYESYVKYLDPSLLSVVDLMAYGSNGNVIAKLECGKNIYDENQNFLTNTGVNGYGNIVTSAGTYLSPVFYPIKPSTTYKCNNNYGMFVVQYDSRKKYISALGTGTAATITTASNAAYVLFQVYSQHLSGTKTQLEIGTVSTFWEPYTLGYMGALSTQKVTAVSVMMGINDLGTDQDLRGVAALFPAWKTRIDTIIAAAQADGISKFALLIPSGCYGRQNNQTGQFSAKKTASIWEARKLMIDNYSSLEGSGVYLVDTGSAFDPDYGHYFSTSQKPFSDYAGTDLEKFIANEPHPAAEGYYQMAYRIAAWIQSVR